MSDSVGPVPMNTNVVLGTGEVVWLRSLASWSRIRNRDGSLSCDHSGAALCAEQDHETVILWEIVHGESAPGVPEQAIGMDATRLGLTPAEYEALLRRKRASLLRERDEVCQELREADLASSAGRYLQERWATEMDNDNAVYSGPAPYHDRELCQAIDRAVEVAFNPRDDDMSYDSIMVAAVLDAAAFIEELPCGCDTPDGDPCGRCEVLGRFNDERLER